jgi:Ca2+-binding EF-hand superfamily protein
MRRCQLTATIRNDEGGACSCNVVVTRPFDTGENNKTLFHFAVFLEHDEEQPLVHELEPLSLKAMLGHYVAGERGEQIDPSIATWISTGKKPSMRRLLAWIVDRLVICGPENQPSLSFEHECDSREENTTPKHQMSVKETQPKKRQQQQQQQQKPRTIHARRKGSKAAAAPAPMATAPPPAPKAPHDAFDDVISGLERVGFTDGHPLSRAEIRAMFPELAGQGPLVPPTRSRRWSSAAEKDLWSVREEGDGKHSMCSARAMALEETKRVFGENRVLQELWMMLDANGNGNVSLAEIDKMVVDLSRQEGKFDGFFVGLNHKDAMMRAYKWTLTREKSSDGDDYIQRQELRPLLKNLHFFNTLWREFDSMDTDGPKDGRLNLDEFEQGLKKIGLTVDSRTAMRMFGDADTDNGGLIMFHEYCDAVMKHLKLMRRRNGEEEEEEGGGRGEDGEEDDEDGLEEEEEEGMGDGRLVAKMHGHMATAVAETKEVFGDGHDHQLLSMMWLELDCNGNGIVSLAEIDKFVRDQQLKKSLSNPYGTFFSGLDHAPALMRAYKWSLDCEPSSDGDDYIERHELRPLLKNLHFFNTLWRTFAHFVPDGETRMDYNEFYDGLHSMGLVRDGGVAMRIFMEVDADGGGLILFHEFCDYIMRRLGLGLKRAEQEQGQGTSTSVGTCSEERSGGSMSCGRKSKRWGAVRSAVGGSAALKRPFGGGFGSSAPRMLGLDSESSMDSSISLGSKTTGLQRWAKVRDAVRGPGAQREREQEREGGKEDKWAKAIEGLVGKKASAEKGVPENMLKPCDGKALKAKQNETYHPGRRVYRLSGDTSQGVKSMPKCTVIKIRLDGSYDIQYDEEDQTKARRRKLLGAQSACFEQHQGFGTSSTRFPPEKLMGKRTAMEKKYCVDVLGGWDCWPEG